MTVTLKSLPRRAMLTLDTGTAVEVEKLGKGRYTMAWRSVSNPAVVYLQVSDRDNSKELLSHLDGVHIPKLEQCGQFTAEETLYRTQFYEPLTASNRPAWNLFKVLQRYAEQALREAQPKYNERLNVQRVNEDFASLVEEDDALPQSIRDDVRALVNWACSYGEYLIEISKRNLAVDGETLILLDPVFDYAEVERANQEAKRRAERRSAYR